MEATDVEVVERLLDQVRDVLDERGLAVEVADRPELGQHLLAEPMGGRDRRGVEVRNGVGQPVAPDADLAVGPGREQRYDRVVVLDGCAGEDPRQRLLAPDEPLADAVAQLARRHPRERDQEQSVKRRALGHVARGQRRDRVRLARPGARLEHRHPRGQRTADVELGVRRDGAHRSPISSRASRPSHSRRA